MKTPPNGPFYLGPTPKPKDHHKYNAFGILIGFGRAKRVYYRKLDRQARHKEAKRSC